MRAQLITPYADQVRADVALTETLGRQQQAVRNISERTVARLKFPLKRVGDEYGLGRLIAQSADAFNMPDLFAGVIVLAAAGIALTAGFSWLENRLVPWTKD